MYIFLGNQTIEQLESRTGWHFTEDEREWLNTHRQDKAEVRRDSDKFHIFDIPFHISMGERISEELIDLLKSKEVPNETIHFSIAEETEQEKIEKKRKAEAEAFAIKRKDESIRWMWKWTLRVPIDEQHEYGCFINTECYGYDNHGEPRGTFRICIDEEGLHGNFKLDNPEINKTNHPEWDYVIGIGMYRNGAPVKSFPFDWIEGRIEDYLVGTCGVLECT